MAEKSRLAPELIQEFVSAAHADLGRVRELLARQPALANAAWDWGNGDFETALGAAAHMGRKDIARLLLDKEARIDIFAAAMLGHLETVEAMIKAVPEARNWRGPHGIPLLRHAEVGGAEAARVADFLRGLVSA
jgi:hypothetical protein